MFTRIKLLFKLKWIEPSIHDMRSAKLLKKIALFQIYFGATVARYYLAFNVFGIPCFTGMSYLVKKPCVDEFGGLSWFGKFLAEDFFLAKLLHER